MTRLTALQIRQLDNMNEASQRAGGVGTMIDALQYGGISNPSVGSIATNDFVSYAVTPANASTTATKAAFALTASPQAGITAGITQPDFPRALTITGNASGITGNVVIHGTNINGDVISDTLALNGASTVYGVKAFKTVTSIDYPAEVHGGTDTVAVGRANLIGFPIAIPNASLVVAKSFDGSADAGSITVSSTVEGSLYAQAGTFNGTKILKLWIMV